MAKFILKKQKTAWDRGVCRLLRGLHVSLFNYAAIVNLNDDWSGKKIMLGNHSGAKGACVYRLSSPDEHYFMTWGAHQMIENYSSRWKYLYYIFYRQKLGYSKRKAFRMSTLFAIISKIIYRIAGILPIYYDMRFKNTIQHSLTCFDNDVDILIFPEDSTNGYFDELIGITPGFLTLSKTYFKRYGIDLPIYPLYFNRKYMTIVVGKPLYLQELQKTMSQQEILNLFMNEINGLNHKYILRDMPLSAGDVSLEEFDRRDAETMAKMAKRDVKVIKKFRGKQAAWTASEATEQNGEAKN